MKDTKLGEKMDTKDILENIINLATNGNADIFEKPFDSIKRQLRYYREDIPARPRYLYDADAVFFYNYDNVIRKLNGKERREYAERGDIMTSIWAPLSYYLRINGEKIMPKNSKSIDGILNFKNVEKKQEAFELFDHLSQNYASRGNLLLLPNTTNNANRRNLNPDKFRYCEDKIDQFLYLCLKPDSPIRPYFNSNDDYVKEWIKSERLECMFSAGFFDKGEDFIGEVDISINNLQSLINCSDKIEKYKYKDLSVPCWKTYFERLNKVIDYRNNAGITPHKPYSWDKNCSNAG